jgi:hypothetical protein
MAGFDPAIPTRSVAAWDFLFRHAGACGDGRVKPGHDVLGHRPTYVNLSAVWY